MRVVVVPERRGVLIVRVVVVERAAGGDHVHRVAVVLGRDVAAVQVHVGLERQRVALAHDDLAALAGADRRARVDALVAVDRGLEAGQDLGHALADRDLVGVLRARARDRQQLRDARQVALEGLERRARLRAQRRRGHLGLAAAQRGRRGDRAQQRERAEAVAHEVATRPRVGGRAEAGHLTFTVLVAAGARLPIASAARSSTV